MNKSNLAIVPEKSMINFGRILDLQIDSQNISEAESDRKFKLTKNLNEQIDRMIKKNIPNEDTRCKCKLQILTVGPDY